MGATLEGAELARMRRIGVVAMEPGEGLRLFDDALADARPVLVPARLDTAALRTGSGTVPLVLRGLAGLDGEDVSARPAHGTGAGREGQGAGRADGRSGERLVDRMAAQSPDEWRELVLDVVRGAIAAVLGHAAPGAVGEDRGLLALGFDSLTAVELRNRLNAETGLRLPTTLVFDYPTAGALADHLKDELAPEAGASGSSEASDATVSAQLDLIEASLPGIALDRGARTAVADRLRAVLRQLGDAERPVDTAVRVIAAPVGSEDLGAATDDEIFRLIDTEFGTD